METPIQPARSSHRWRRSLVFIRPLATPITFILILTLIVAGMNAVEPLVLKLLFDGLGMSGTVAVVVRYGLLLLGLALLREGLSAVSNWLTWRTRLKLHYGLLEAVVGRLHQLPLCFHRTEGVGATMTRIDRGIQGFVGAFSEAAFSVVPAFAYLVLSLTVMLKLEWRLALVALVFAPLPPLVAALSAGEQTRRERTLLDRWAAIYARFNEVLSGITTVKSFVMEDREKQRFLGDVAAANQIVVKGVGIDSGIGAAQSLVVALARVASIVVGGLLLLDKQITLGTLIAFWGYVGGLFAPVQNLSGTYKTLRRASVSLDTLYDVLDAPDQVADSPSAPELGPVAGEVAFEQVRFRYQEGQEVLSGVDLRVRAGETVAIVGPSGGGKSTLMSLLQRFHDPVAGRITVDGQDIREIKQQSLRRQIGVVQQEPVLFNDSVHQNLAYGRPGTSPAEVVAAAKAANIHEMIMRLPDGYQTLVGERGSRFSAGERQRLAIARALLKNPPLLILDEATSALDAETEASVQEAIRRLTRGRTTFVIAHRLATTVMADRILVLRDGKVSECGRHQELMVLGGYYARLVQCQVDGLLLPAAA